ncbi:FAD-NAD(P)-binding [Streptomyces sp. yr375]|uniref:FAD/NAD(P)-binding protein n=1 Tax=Streptomyces sp. yr375 TaxID=1761906 RepID=UPI0008B48395|nr:FAD/NAD(P)-binding protein [Streptomyces sp. yr375]SER61628.1 FAD-NAD(P)-binding [Streptomyces sp. yr375]
MSVTMNERRNEGYDEGHLAVCLVGAGPRGLCLLERLCANERTAPSHASVTVHVVDPAPPGAGAVWRTDQSRHLLTNTVASQITVFTDASTRTEGPIEPGPSLYEWAAGLARREEPGGYEETVVAEARALGPDSYPTRALYGHYLRDCFRRVVARAPAHVTVTVHRSRAVAMADTHGVPGGPQGVRLADGTRIHDLDAVVLAQGHLPAQLTPRQERTASLARIHHLAYVPPANPADVDTGRVEPGEPVLLRGLGLNFFDYMALFTVGRGGTFDRVRDGVGDRLVYRPSGREPRLYASSRRGVPYHARGENEKGAFGRHTPRLLTPEVIAALRDRSRDGERVRFRADVWPLVAAEVEAVYYGTLLAARGATAARAEEFVDRYLSAPPRRRAALLDDEDHDGLGIAPADRWDWERLARPCHGRTFADRDDFRDWLLDYLAQDVREARAGNVSGPLKAALDVLRDLRNEVRLVVDHGGLEGGSHLDELEGWFTPLNAFLSIGPPVTRTEEMIALIEAGILELTGPGTQIRVDTDRPAFVARSTVVPGPPIRSRHLIEARLPPPDLRRTADPLLRHLFLTEQCRPFHVDGECGVRHETGGLSVTERPGRLVDGQGRPHPRRFAYGVPTESVHWVTAAGVRPGVDSVTLGDADAIARAVLALAPARETPARPAVAGNSRFTGVIV